jgi:hypothetical protein
LQGQHTGADLPGFAAFAVNETFDMFFFAESMLEVFFTVTVYLVLGRNCALGGNV